GQDLALLLVDLQHQGYVIAQVFFGLFLLPLGFLVFRSGWLPKAIGLALMVGAGGYVAGVALNFIPAVSGAAVYPALVGGLAELTFLVWLLVMGVRESTAIPSRGALV